MHNKGKGRHNGSSKGHYQYSNGNLEKYQNVFDKYVLVLFTCYLTTEMKSFY
jgi:hypothetical protein